MDRRAWTYLMILALLWGASYLFIKVGLEDFSPAMVVFLRTALAALMLVPLALYRGALDGLRGRWGSVLLVALVQVAAPFMLITLAEESISSALAGILVAAAPLFTALIAPSIDKEESSRGAALVGVAIGFVGVALLLGVDLAGDSSELLGGGMVLLAALGYAISGFLVKSRFREVEPLSVVTATLGVSALMLAPWAALSLPTEAPSFDSVGALIALGVGGTGFAFILFYRLLRDVGPAKASLVTYLAPAFAVLWGVALLDESISLATLAGLALILGGSWFGASTRAAGRPARQATPIASKPPARTAVPITNLRREEAR